MKVKMNAKLAIRIAILTVGLVGTFIAASGLPVPVADGGPIPTCTPQQVKSGTCKDVLPPLMS